MYFLLKPPCMLQLFQRHLSGMNQLPLKCSKVRVEAVTATVQRNMGGSCCVLDKRSYFPRHPGEYLLRFGVLGMFLGPNTFLGGVWMPRVWDVQLCFYFRPENWGRWTNGSRRVFSPTKKNRLIFKAKVANLEIVVRSFCLGWILMFSSRLEHQAILNPRTATGLSTVGVPTSHVG